MSSRTAIIVMRDICCGECDIIFGMEERFYNARVNDGKGWYCPNGHRRHFNTRVTSDAAKLAAAEERLAAQMTENALLRKEKNRVSAQFKGLRKRIFNGVCPCCTRSFPNLMAHMRTKHPDYLSTPTNMQDIRKIFGMTQGDVGKEAFVSPPYVSKYERGIEDIPEWAKKRLDFWMKTYTGEEEKV